MEKLFKNTSKNPFYFNVAVNSIFVNGSSLNHFTPSKHISFNLATVDLVHRNTPPLNSNLYKFILQTTQNKKIILKSHHHQSSTLPI